MAASLQAPELFVIAENLADMRVDTAIDESEIGKIIIGQRATFTVDAFPGKTFEGEVRKVRKSAQVISNVVTYLVDVSAPNPEMQLLPGMTANVRIVTDTYEDVLKVPNAAIRFRPPQSPDDKPEKSRRGDGDKSGRGNARPDPSSSTIYLLKNAELKAIPVKTGASDGKMVQVTGDGLAEGMDVVTGVKGEGGGSRKGSSMAGAPRMF